MRRGEMEKTNVPNATINRIPLYLRSLQEVKDRNRQIISSHELAEIVGVQPAQLRKDLSYLGEFGTRGVGYEVEHLEFQLAKRLGLTREWSIAVIGAGRIGSALLYYKGFKERNLTIRAILDIDEKKIGKKVGSLIIQDMRDLERVVREENIDVGIITTPAASAQGVADQLVKAGVKAILNFAPASINVPEGVVLRHVDLAVELQILTFFLRRHSLMEEKMDEEEVY